MFYRQTNLAYYYEETLCYIGDSCMVCEAESCVYRAEGVYTPRNAEDNPLYQVVADNLKTFLSDQQQRDRPVPFFVEREMRAFLDCGIPSHGFIRVHCDSAAATALSRFPAKAAVSAHHAVDAAWRTPPRIWLIAYFPKFEPVNGC